MTRIRWRKSTPPRDREIIGRWWHYDFRRYSLGERTRWDAEANGWICGDGQIAPIAPDEWREVEP